MATDALTTWTWYPDQGSWLVEYTAGGPSDSALMVFDPEFAARTGADPEDESEAGFHSVAIYMVDRAYGGPEEGGWWYDCGERVDDMSELAEIGELAIPQTFRSADAAYKLASVITERLRETLNQGRRDIGSVLSTGRYAAIVHEGYPPPHFPARRPHYE